MICIPLICLMFFHIIFLLVLKMAWPKSSCILNINFAVIFNLLINIKIDENSYKVACDNVEQLISSKNQFNFLNEVK